MWETGHSNLTFTTAEQKFARGIPLGIPEIQ